MTPPPWTTHRKDNSHLDVLFESYKMVIELENNDLFEESCGCVSKKLGYNSNTQLVYVDTIISCHKHECKTYYMDSYTEVLRWSRKDEQTQAKRS